MTAKLNIRVALRESCTYLKNCFHTTPFKIANITENKSQRLLKLMLMTSSPGILDGDEYDIKLELGEECFLQLETQSYQRLFTMKKGASQNMEVFMNAGSSFCFLPHPSVPHKGSIFTSKNKIHLSRDCRLAWGEILTCGRSLNGEEFQFSKYHSLTEILLNGRLVIKDNLFLNPTTTNLNAIGQYEGFTHQANLFIVSEKLNSSLFIHEINEFLAEKENICFGISALPVTGIVVRILGFKGEKLHQLLKSIVVLINRNHLPDLISERAENYAN